MEGGGPAADGQAAPRAALQDIALCPCTCCTCTLYAYTRGMERVPSGRGGGVNQPVGGAPWWRSSSPWGRRARLADGHLQHRQPVTSCHAHRRRSWARHSRGRWRLPPPHSAVRRHSPANADPHKTVEEDSSVSQASAAPSPSAASPGDPTAPRPTPPSAPLPTPPSPRPQHPPARPPHWMTMRLTRKKVWPGEREPLLADEALDVGKCA